MHAAYVVLVDVVGEVKDEEMAVRARVRLGVDGLRHCLRHMRLRRQ